MLAKSALSPGSWWTVIVPVALKMKDWPPRGAISAPQSLRVSCQKGASYGWSKCCRPMATCGLVSKEKVLFVWLPWSKRVDTFQKRRHARCGRVYSQSDATCPKLYFHLDAFKRPFCPRVLPPPPPDAKVLGATISQTPIALIGVISRTHGEVRDSALLTSPSCFAERRRARPRASAATRGMLVAGKKYHSNVGVVDSHRRMFQ